MGLNDFFGPGCTDYKMRHYYNTYDVTPLIRQGDNAVGVTIADGWYAGGWVGGCGGPCLPYMPWGEGHGGGLVWVDIMRLSWVCLGTQSVCMWYCACGVHSMRGACVCLCLCVMTVCASHRLHWVGVPEEPLRLRAAAAGPPGRGAQ